MSAGETRATVLMSGGVDSAACAHFLKEQGLMLDALFLNYGQAAAKFEARAVAAIAEHINIPLICTALSTDVRSGKGELVGRNALLLFTSLFLTRGQSHVLAIGVHSGTPYFDCSESFVSSISRLVEESTNGCTSVIAPFLSWSKNEVFDYFVSSDLPLDLTYSCETGTDPTCGKCLSCRDRSALQC